MIAAIRELYALFNIRYLNKKKNTAFLQRPQVDERDATPITLPIDFKIFLSLPD